MASTLILNLPAPELRENFFLLFKPPSLWYIIMTAWTHQHTYYLLCVYARSCSTLCDHVVCSPPGSSVHGILQARILVGCQFLFHIISFILTIIPRGKQMPSGIQARLLITLISIRPNSWDLHEWPGGRVVRTSRVKGWKAHSCCFLALTAQHQWFLGNSLMKPNCRKPSSDHFSTVHGKMREGQLGDWMKSSTLSSTPPIYVHINGAEQTLRNLR